MSSQDLSEEGFHSSATFTTAIFFYLQVFLSNFRGITIFNFFKLSQFLSLNILDLSVSTLYKFPIVMVYLGMLVYMNISILYLKHSQEYLGSW